MNRPASPRPSLCTDRKGAALVEFAVVAPVMCLLLVGSFDEAHTLYMQAALQGVVQKAGRDSSLEDSTSDVQNAIDARVKAQVLVLANNADVTIGRKSYRTFSDAVSAKAENWTDNNGNGRCDQHEPYVDANRNGSWDSDGSNGAQGGAKDKTIYTVTVKYPRMLPLNRFIDVPDKQTLVAQAVVQNQPYADQSDVGTDVLHCD